MRYIPVYLLYYLRITRPGAGKNRAKETMKPTRHRCRLAALDNWIEGGETSVGVNGAVAGDLKDDTDAKTRRRTGMGWGARACGSQLQDFEMIKVPSQLIRGLDDWRNSGFRVVDGLEGQDLKFEAVREDMELIQAQRATGVEESFLREMHCAQYWYQGGGYELRRSTVTGECREAPGVVAICCNRMQDGSWKAMGDGGIRESVETELWAVVGKDLDGGMGERMKQGCDTALDKKLSHFGPSGRPKIANNGPFGSG
ncbi:hypothetical protein B0H16DRAFT_1847951 [Mycena metata]|uniref:Uncharacterized protein n=1 Tax=Mycena metata TaxID=1033252 RepID=A0AAD7N8G3_9AGAR|nr:hypothetical protein B0H16DRAFT_1847951 [Mycena metata]